MPRKPDVPCSTCGELLWSGSTSLPSGLRMCRTCRGSDAAAGCQGCGGEIPHRKYQGNQRRWCSESCRLRAYRARTPDWYKYTPRASTARRCRVCGISFEGRGTRQRCDECAAVGAVELAFCEWCTQIFRAHRGVRCCSRSCGQAAAHARRPKSIQSLVGKGHHGRAARYGVTYERVDRLKVFERDIWVCQLCEFAVDPEVAYPDPMSASLDHIVPMSRGGEHSYTNTQLAHLGCNIAKGAREVA